MIDTSNNMLYHIKNLNTSSQKINYQMATGKAIDKGSENSLLHASLINLDDKLRVTEDLKLQIEKSKAINDTADQSLAEMKIALDKIKVDLMKGMNAGMDRNDKLALATNLEGIRANIFDGINVKVDGEYIFTGSETTKQTLVKDDNFKLNGKVDFGGDGFLRKIAVQPGSYRQRGITAYDASFYTSNKANAGEAFSFSKGERVIDENGHEWKLNSNGTKLQQYDHNGDIYYPRVEIDIKLSPAKEFAIDLGMGANSDANGVYTITINGKAYSYDGTAGGKSANDIYTSLQTDLANDGYSVSALTNNDQFTIIADNEVSLSISDTDANYITSAINEKEATGTSQAIQASYTMSTGVPTSPEGRVFEAKHNYFDDLNIMINALKGHSTKLDGTKGNSINDTIVRSSLSDALEQTVNQFDATNIGHGELGGRNAVFDVAYDKLLSQSTHYNILIQETGGADMAKLAMESKSLELTYQALYSTISKINQLSLVNFLK